MDCSRIKVVAAVVMIGTLLMQPTQAATITVNTLADPPGAPFANGLCTLREAVVAANDDVPVDGCDGGDPGSDSIEIVIAGEIVLNGTELPEVTSSLSIEGLGMDETVIDAAGLSRIITFSDDLELNALTLTGGFSTGFGGAVFGTGIGDSLSATNTRFSNNQTEGDSADGGAIYLLGDMSLITSEIVGNQTNGSGSEGGALRTLGELLIFESLISGNRTLGENSRAGAAYLGGNSTCIRSLFSDNGTDGSNSDGGAVLSQNSNLAVLDCEFNGNDTAGSSSEGAAIYALNSQTTIEDSSFVGNSTAGNNANGGAVMSDVTGALTIERSLFEMNRTAGSFSGGGAVYTEADEVLITDSQFLQNYTTGDNSVGGAVAVADTGAVVIASDFQGNYTSGLNSHGGAAWFDDQMTVLALGNTFDSNETQGVGTRGGAIHNEGTILRIGASTFVNNHSMSDGAAIYYDFPGGLVADHGLLLVNNTFSENSIASSGAGMGGAISTDILIAAHNTFFGNEAITSGGAIHVSGTIDMTNNIFVQNTPDACSGVLAPAGQAPNLADVTGCGDATTFSANINLDPELADNGGITETHQLLIGSDAIDSADNGVCTGTDVDSRDQRGAERPQGVACDQGAFEFGGAVLQATANHPEFQDVDVDPATGVSDVVAMDFTLAARETSAENIQINGFTGSLCSQLDIDVNDIDDVAVWQDDGNGAFDPASDIFIDSLTMPGVAGTFEINPPNMTFEFTAGSEPTVDTIGTRYFVVIDVDEAFDLAATPAWSQTAYARNSRQAAVEGSSMSIAAQIMFSLMALALLSVFFSHPGVGVLRVMLLSAVFATALTACSGGSGGGSASSSSSDDGGGGVSTVPIAGTADATFCLNIQSIDAEGIGSGNSLPVAGLDVIGSEVRFHEQ